MSAWQFTNWPLQVRRQIARSGGVKLFRTPCGRVGLWAFDIKESCFWISKQQFYYRPTWFSCNSVCHFGWRHYYLNVQYNSMYSWRHRHENPVSGSLALNFSFADVPFTSRLARGVCFPQWSPKTRRVSQQCNQSVSGGHSDCTVVNLSPLWRICRSNPRLVHHPH
jgi:hypothetical protein